MRRGENIYKRKDGRWEGRYKKGYKANGKIKYGYIYARTLREARIKLYSLKNYYQTHQEVQGNSWMTLEEWGNIWLQDIQWEVKPSTYSSYYYKLKKYVFSFVGDIYLSELSSIRIKKLIQQWEDMGLEHSTMQVILRTINQCLKSAQQKSHLKANPFQMIKLPRKRKKAIHALTRKEQKRLEKTALAEKNNTGLPTYLSLYTGMRIGEISALQWEDIDFEQNIIHVNHTYQRISLRIKNKASQLIFGSTKTDSGSRSIPLGKTLRRLLLKHKRRSSGAFVFTTNDHPMEPRLLTYHFHRIRKKCGLEEFHFHQLRHTFATRCLESQNDILSVSALLGHASTKLTLDTYADSMMDQRVEVIYCMESTIK